MRTALAERVDSTGAPDEDDRDAANVDSSRPGLGELLFRQHRDEILPLGVLGVVDADALAVDEMPAEVCRRQREREAETGDTASGRAVTALPKSERDRVERRGGKIQQAMEQADAAILRDGVLPVGDAGDGGADGADEADADRCVGGQIATPITIGPGEIEDGGNRPRAQRDIGEHRMNRVTEPGAVKDITNATAGLPAGLVDRDDCALQSVRDGLEPVLTLAPLDRCLTELAKSLFHA